MQLTTTQRPPDARFDAFHADGSVDIHFGPTAPPGQEPNWVPTSPKGEFEVLFRFYGPDKSLFDKNWRLPDLEQS